MAITFNKSERKVLFRDVIVECIATVCYVSVGIASALSWGRSRVNGDLIQAGLGQGAVAIAMMEAFGAMGGVYMNPALTVSMVIAGKMHPIRALLFVFSELGGAIAGAALIYWFTPSEFRESLGVTGLHPEVSVYQGLGMEAWMTFVLVMTYFGSTNERRRAVYMAALPVGMAVLMNVMAGNPYTGAGFNPARSFGPAVIMNLWDDHWVYWIGPLFGGAVATLLYVHVFDRVGRPKYSAPTYTNEGNGVLKNNESSNGSVGHSPFSPTAVQDIRNRSPSYSSKF